MFAHAHRKFIILHKKQKAQAALIEKVRDEKLAVAAALNLLQSERAKKLKEDESIAEQLEREKLEREARIEESRVLRALDKKLRAEKDLKYYKANQKRRETMERLRQEAIKKEKAEIERKMRIQIEIRQAKADAKLLEDERMASLAAKAKRDRKVMKLGPINDVENTQRDIPLPKGVVTKGISPIVSKKKGSKSP